ncbi:hypothetical protein [Methylophaga sp.]|uniref:hypothetical protein n=1 Tax=Methylophaga sp. TaxID=2024840 RepID=UPI003F696014
MESTINREKFHGKFAAIFNDEASANEARKLLMQKGSFSAGQINIVRPHDRAAGHKIEPETSAIGKVLLTSHVVFGGMGLILGLLIASLTSTFGPTFAQSSPLLTHLALGLIGLFLGLIVAGAVSLRPDHDPLITKTLEACEHDQWAVIVQTKEFEDNERARQLLKPVAVSVTETL